jgi:hypothetical protein
MEPLTKTDLCQLTGFTKERVTKAISSLTPVSTSRRIVRYDPVAGIRALLHSEETDKERGERLKSDLLDEKLRRMKGESISLRACRLVWGEKLKRLADTIRGIDYLETADKRRLCQQLRSDLDRLPDELMNCKFDEAEGGEEEQE